MPQLKPPVSLQTMAMNSLVKFVMRYLDDLSETASPAEFRQGISAIKEDVRSRIPRHFLPEFSTKFVKAWKLRKHDPVKVNEEIEWKKSHYEAAVEMLMDVEIVGLKCDVHILQHINPEDMYRIIGLAQLNVRYIEERQRFQIMKNCNLNDITTIFTSSECTDDFLSVIGEKCSKLRNLSLLSFKITDEGLRALDPCRELRSVDFEGCAEVSHVGINHLLSVHDKLQVFNYEIWDRSDWNQMDGCHFLSCMENPYLSLKRFHIRTKDAVTDAHLHSIVVNFPNLTHIELEFVSIGNLSILKSLSNLEGISLELFGWSYSDSDFLSVWQNLKDLLTIIGRNITTLIICDTCCARYPLERESLNYIYEFCPDIEKLKLGCAWEDLVVPPFRKLKVLCLSTRKIGSPYWISIQVEKNCTMLNLERLYLDGYFITMDAMKSMILDGTKFPKLRKLLTYDYDSDAFEEIRQFAMSNNIDFQLQGIDPWIAFN